MKTKTLMIAYRLKAIPPGANPYNFDLIRMGADVSKDWHAMYYSSSQHEELVLHRTATGERYMICYGWRAILRNHPWVVQGRYYWYKLRYAIPDYLRRRRFRQQGALIRKIKRK